MINFVSYAQNFEDVMLWRALKEVENGFYIDLGAQDPLRDSVSLAFHQRGWRGVHVEPAARYAQMLRDQRPGDMVIQAAVGEGVDLLTFYEIEGTGLSTVDEQIAKQHQLQGYRFRQISVPCVSLSSILDACKQDDIHWMKIDVEGSERSALASWGKAAGRPWIVVIESTRPMTQIPSHEEWEHLLLLRGYEHVYFDGLNRYYLWKDKAELKAAFQAPPNVFDDFSVSDSVTTGLHRYVKQQHTVELTVAAEKVEHAVNENESLKIALEARLAELQLLEQEHLAEITALRKDFSCEKAAWAAAREELFKTLTDSALMHAAREREFSERLTAQSQAHSVAMSELEGQVGRTTELLSDTKERLRAAFDAARQDALRSAQVLSARENEWGEQLAHRIEESHRMTANAQQESTRELNVVRRQAYEQSAELLRRHETERSELSEMVRVAVAARTQEVSMLHDARREESHILKSEIEALRNAEAALRTQGKENREQHDRNVALILSQLRTEQERCAHLLELASSAGEEIAHIKRSRSWRLTAPLRRMFLLFSSSSSTRPVIDTETRCTLNHPDALSKIPPPSVSPPILSEIADHLSTEISAPRLASSEVLLMKKITYAELAMFDGGEFVDNCYVKLLHRQADVVGRSHYLSLIDRGEDKATIIADIRRSKEGLQLGEKVVGLSWRVARVRFGQWPILGFILRARSHDLGRAVRAIDNRLYRLITAYEASEAWSGQPSHQSVTLNGRSPLQALAAAASVIQPSVGKSLVSDLVSARPNKRVIYFVLDLNWVRDSEEVRLSTRLVDGFLEMGEAVRFVYWNDEGVKFELMSQLVLDNLALAQPEGNGSALISGVQPSVDPIGGQPNGWMLVPARVRSGLGSSELIDMNMILGAKQLGLNSVYVFHGAEELRSSQFAGSDVEAHEQYMQALLLADVIIPISAQSTDELQSFFVQHQKADWAPLLQQVPLPAELTGDPLGAWAECAGTISALLNYATDKSYQIEAVYFWIEENDAADWSFNVRLARELVGTGVALIPVVWDEKSGQLVSAECVFRNALQHSYSQGLWAGWIEPGRAHAPKWVLLSNISDGGCLAHVTAAAKSYGLRTAAIPSDKLQLDVRQEPKSDLGREELLRALARVDKVFTTSEQQFQQFEQFLLSWRGKIQSAEHRFSSLVPPSNNGQNQSSWIRYSRAILAALAEDRLTDTLHGLAKDSGKDVYKTLEKLQRRPKLSICISTYNRAGWLEVNLRNIFAQIGTVRDDLEVLVVDNTSRDNTPEVVKQYLQRSDFRYTRNIKNVGMLGNLAVTAQRARGEYVWILGDDDLTRPGAIEKVLQIIDEHPGLALIYLNYGYTSEGNPSNVTDLPFFLANYNILEPAGPDEFAQVKHLAAKCENFFTAIYSHVYRRDHALRSYCQDTSGRIFSTMRSCVPTAYYVLNFMADEPAYWVGEPSIVVNSNVSWYEYGALLELEQLPRTWDLAERVGTAAAEVDRRRANRLWLVEQMWRQIYESDKAGNSAYFSASRSLMRLKHLPEIDKYIPEFASIYERARTADHPAAVLPTDELFSAFSNSLTVASLATAA